jgi:hypothetical protein
MRHVAAHLRACMATFRAARTVHNQAQPSQTLLCTACFRLFAGAMTAANASPAGWYCVMYTR